MEVRDQLHAPDALNPAKVLPVPTGQKAGWNRADLDAMEMSEILPLPGIETRPSSP
jgi:hypothetical protein